MSTIEEVSGDTKVAVRRLTQACASQSTRRDSRARQTSALRRPHPASRGDRNKRLRSLNMLHFILTITDKLLFHYKSSMCYIPWSHL